jgi:hypothetical protein
MKILPEWLTQRAENAPIPEHRNLPAMPALRIRMAWQKLKSRAGEADEVWAFVNPASTWKRQGKHTGYALRRDEKTIVESIVVKTERR